MWYAAVMRFLRRRIVLGIIFTLSLTYCIVSFMSEDDYSDNDVSIPVKRSQPFRWRTLQEHSFNDSDIYCRNSVQGQVLIVDDQGYVCPRMEVLTNGCCNIEKLTNAVQYSCQTCKPNNCCAMYEYCVSCCLHPDKKSVLEYILGKATEQNNVLLTSVSDHFELCLAKCRTNSQSVKHENTYRDPNVKHCYGESAPTIATN